MRLNSILSAISLSALMSMPALAQDDMSVDQLRQLFEKQKQAFKEASSNPQGKTRGLRLVTVEDVAPQTATGGGAQVAATAAAPTAAAQAPDGITPVAADPNEPLVFGQLDPELQVNLHIEFGFDSAALSETERPKLTKMCQVLSTGAVEKVRIVGHTDAAGSDAYNERLSVMRAEEVARALVDDCGVPADHIETLGLGERFPFNADNPRADENRRVEFQALS